MNWKDKLLELKQVRENNEQTEKGFKPVHVSYVEQQYRKKLERMNNEYDALRNMSIKTPNREGRAILYKITYIPEKLEYYGIVYAAHKTVEERFKEHMNAEEMSSKMIRLLRLNGALISDFTVEIINEGPRHQQESIESVLSRNTIFPKGLNLSDNEFWFDSEGNKHSLK